jgi:hypothetical protein
MKQRQPKKMSSAEALERRHKYQRKWYQDHKEKAREYQREYYRQHRKYNSHRRRARFIMQRELTIKAITASGIMNTPTNKLPLILNKIISGEITFSI